MCPNPKNSSENGQGGAFCFKAFLDDCFARGIILASLGEYALAIAPTRPCCPSFPSPSTGRQLRLTFSWLTFPFLQANAARTFSLAYFLGLFSRHGDDSRLVELFTREVLGFLIYNQLLSREWADRLLSWRHSGFSVHSRVRAHTKPEAERVGKYMIRPLLSLERRIIDRLKLTFKAEKPPPSRVFTEIALGEVERPAEDF